MSNLSNFIWEQRVVDFSRFVRLNEEIPSNKIWSGKFRDRHGQTGQTKHKNGGIRPSPNIDKIIGWTMAKIWPTGLVKLLHLLSRMTFEAKTAIMEKGGSKHNPFEPLFWEDIRPSEKLIERYAWRFKRAIALLNATCTECQPWRKCSWPPSGSSILGNTVYVLFNCWIIHYLTVVVGVASPKVASKVRITRLNERTPPHITPISIFSRNLPLTQA